MTLKQLIFILLFAFQSTLVSAQLIEAKPMCKDPSVVLNRIPIPCRADDRIPADFDIPELEINYDDIDIIIDKDARGVVNGGGGGISPQDMGTRVSSPRRAEPRFRFNLRFECEAQVISDGDMKFSVLSTQKFILTEYLYSLKLPMDKWEHFLIQGNEFGDQPLYPIPTPTNLEVSQFVIELKNKMRSQRFPEKSFVLTLCEENFTTQDQGTLVACSEVKAPYSAQNLTTQLMTVSQSAEKDFQLTKKLKVNCKKSPL
ncbi:MAG: hypothetical protein CME62_00240 [Halobacteriovoraceae bacterium]|nr:hypothetical protein [Halobacteriovoraceae bacterium]|tara:strand:+ start:15227 stop:16000 length:774 start_codon:yes stop_codon:yes gene_type:complete